MQPTSLFLLLPALALLVNVPYHVSIPPNGGGDYRGAFPPSQRGQGNVREYRQSEPQYEDYQPPHTVKITVVQSTFIVPPMSVARGPVMGMMPGAPMEGRPGAPGFSGRPQPPAFRPSPGHGYSSSYYSSSRSQGRPQPPFRPQNRPFTPQEEEEEEEEEAEDASHDVAAIQESIIRSGNISPQLVAGLDNDPNSFRSDEFFALRSDNKNSCMSTTTTARDHVKLATQKCTLDMDFRRDSPLVFFWIPVEDNNALLAQKIGERVLCATHRWYGTRMEVCSQESTRYQLTKPKKKGYLKIRDAGKNSSCMDAGFWHSLTMKRCAGFEDQLWKKIFVSY